MKYNHRESQGYENLRSVLSSYKKILLIYGQGNAGDGLIQLGTKQYFDYHNFSVEFINRYDPDICQYVEQQSPHTLLAFAGSGIFTKTYPEDCKFIVNLIEASTSDIAFLPCSIDSEIIFNSLHSLDRKVYIFCRELQSFENVKDRSYRNSVSSYLCHDMAFYIDIEVVYDTNVGSITRFNRAGVRALIQQLCLSFRLFRGFNSFRHDLEANKNRRLPICNQDLSVSIISTHTGNFLRFEDMTNRGIRLLHELRELKYVNTDRLHVAIGCALVSTQCCLHPGSYYKNASIYSFSMKDAPHINFNDNMN